MTISTEQKIQIMTKKLDELEQYIKSIIQLQKLLSQRLTSIESTTTNILLLLKSNEK